MVSDRRWVRTMRLVVGITELAFCLVCVGFALAGGGWPFWVAAALLAILGTLRVFDYGGRLRGNVRTGA
jgi:hypothetical protein